MSGQPIDRDRLRMDQIVCGDMGRLERYSTAAPETWLRLSQICAELLEHREQSAAIRARCEELEKAAAQVFKWKLCMSYNDSYFGEPEGELKRAVADLERTALSPASGGV